MVSSKDCRLGIVILRKIFNNVSEKYEI